MTDITDPPETSMQHASEHASRISDPHDLTPTALPLPTEPATVRPSSISEESSHISNTSNPSVHEDDSSPVTSAISSQVEFQESTSPAKQNKEDIAQTSVQNGQRSETSSQSPPPNSLSGTKRTASGQVKRSSVNGLADVISHSNGINHGRKESTVSQGSTGNVLELSQQLRTKLKYAMVKVQNGWQMRSFDEVESLASQSPRSTVSGWQRSGEQHVLSPRAAMSRRYQRESSESDSSESTLSLENRGLNNMTGSPQVPSRRALAPPVDIMPGSRRRPTPNVQFHALNGHPTQVRHLHSARPTNTQRTPSQNAAMEADAVETLLFMASPNNSGYNPPSHASQDSTLRSSQGFVSQTSPLRTQFSKTSMVSPKRVVFSNARRPLDKAAIIDRMLDEMSDESDDELEQAFRHAERSKFPTQVSI